MIGLPMAAGAPTPYPAVNALLDELLAGVRAILGEGFVGLYLFGSLTTGDFDDASDVDFVVVTREDVRGEALAALAAFHARLAQRDSPWATQLEGNYIPAAALRRPDPNRMVHPHLDRGVGETLHPESLEGRLAERHSLREHGLVIAGPPPHTFMDPLPAAELQAAVRADLRAWHAPMLADPWRLESRGYQSYTVLTLCRMLYTLRTGQVTSKPAAARWAQAELGERWAPLIERALANRHGPYPPADAEDVRQTQELHSPGAAVRINPHMNVGVYWLRWRCIGPNTYVNPA